MDERISVRLDRVSLAALRVLTSDGTSVADAVRAAITEAGERYPEPPVPDEGLPMEGLTYAEWITAQVDAAPPPSEYTVYAMRAAFVDRRDTWLSEEQWQASRDGSKDDHTVASPRRSRV